MIFLREHPVFFIHGKPFIVVFISQTILVFYMCYLVHDVCPFYYFDVTIYEIVGYIFSPVHWLAVISRLLPPVYSDGIESIRRATNKHSLPNARQISATFTKFSEVKGNHSHTMAVLQWSQFVEQDLSRVAISPMCK